MAKLLDITDFKGIKTNADIEDLDSQVAQAIENLRLVDGKLIKTYGGGTPSTIPAFDLDTLNSATLGGNTDYVVYNIYTFISDKIPTPTNDAGDGYKYVLVLIDALSQLMKLIWWDEERPNPDTNGEITFFFPIRSDSMILQMLTPHKFDDAGDSSGGHYTLIQDLKSPDGTSLIHSGTIPAGVYDIPESTGTTKILHMNISSGPSYCNAKWLGDDGVLRPVEYSKTSFGGVGDSGSRDEDPIDNSTGMYQSTFNSYGSASMSDGNYISKGY